MRNHLLVSAVIVGTIALTSPVMGQQSLIWPQQESPGVVRDLTHLPALPFFPTDPSNLQSQAWAQPGSAFQYRPSTGWRGPDYPQDFYSQFRFTQSDLANAAADRALQEYRKR